MNANETTATVAVTFVKGKGWNASLHLPGLSGVAHAYNRATADLAVERAVERALVRDGAGWRTVQGVPCTVVAHDVDGNASTVWGWS